MLDSTKRFACYFDGCNKRFKRKFTLNEHIKTHTGVRPYPCTHPGCDSKFSTSGNLKRHQFTHSGERPFECPMDLCEKAFSTKEKLKRHMVTHAGLRLHGCKVKGCGKQFTTSGNLARHVKNFHTSKDTQSDFESTTKLYNTTISVDELLQESETIFDFLVSPTSVLPGSEHGTYNELVPPPPSFFPIAVESFNEQLLEQSVSDSMDLIHSTLFEQDPLC